VSQSPFNRVLPLRTAVSTSAGLASAAVNFLAAVEVAEYAGGQSAWLAILVAGVLIVFAGANFAELSALFPSAAAIRVWLRRGLNDRIALVGSLVYTTTVVLVIAADAYVLGHMFQAAVPGVPGVVWITAILALVVFANLRGIRVAGAIQDGNAFVLLGTLSLFSAAVLIRHWPRVAAPFWHVGPHWIQAVALGIFIYVGFEWVTPLAEEFQDFRAIPRGMFIALGCIAIAFGLFTMALTVVEPNARALAHSLIPQLLLGLKAFGPLGFWWMAAVTVTTAMTTFNGGLLSASRFLYALARERALPGWLSRLNHRLVPARALVILAAMALAMALAVYWTGQYMFFINAGAGVESLMYATSSLLVIQLRRRERSRPRPFSVVGYPVVPVAIGLVFLGLGAGALLTPTSAGGHVPWAVFFFVLLTGAAWAYVRWAVPRLKAKKTARARGAML
jgi:amino acid transporter